MSEETAAIKETAGQVQVPVQPAPHSEAGVLSGGLPLRMLQRPGPGLLSCRLAIRGGSAADPRGQRGAHQLLAGVMSRGCGALDAEALADLVEGAGAGLRVEAGEDSLVLALKCAAEDSEALLPLLLTMVRRPRLEPDQIELERQLNLQTLQRQREDPFQLAHDQLRRQLYGEGPYGHDPLGVEEELAAIGAGDLQPLVNDLGRQGAVLVLCGRIPDRVEGLLEEALEGTPWLTRLPEPTGLSQPSDVEGNPPANAPQGGGETPGRGSLAALAEDTEQLVLMLGCASTPLGHPDSLALRLLQTHLGVGMSSRLFLTMREERGLAYDVGVHLPARCGAAPFVLHLSTSAERAAEATTALLEEWQRLLEEPLDAEAMALTLAKSRGLDAMARQTCSQIAERQALLLSHGLPERYFEDCLQRAGQLTPADLRAAACRWLPAPSLSLVGPEAAIAAAADAWRGHPLGGG